MKDLLKLTSRKIIGLGGPKCPCCNPFRVSRKNHISKGKGLIKYCKRVLRQQTQKQIKNELYES